VTATGEYALAPDRCRCGHTHFVAGWERPYNYAAGVVQRCPQAEALSCLCIHFIPADLVLELPKVEHRVAGRLTEAA